MPFNLVLAWNKRRRSKSHDHIDPWVYKPVECWQLGVETPRPKRRNCSLVFTQKEMEAATCSFSDDNFLGKGGFGRVYKGILRSGEVVAVKKMDVSPFKEADSEREFRVEVDILSRLDHPNLVSLIGYCADGKQRFLVYEYMHNGNLQDHLNGISEVKMNWPSRLKVALGAARGLGYLHSGPAIGIPIVHRDFKSTNILLSENFDAKISDFGLAKLMPEGQDIYATSAVLVLLELLTGRRAVDLNQESADQNLVLQVRHMLSDRKRLHRVIDPGMSRGSYTMESVSLFANLASRCVRIESGGRPTMAECVRELQLIFAANMKSFNQLHSSIKS